MRKKISLLFITLGLFLLAAILFPLVVSQFRFILNEPVRLHDPVSPPRRPGLTILGSLTADYTQASNWFYPASLPQPQASPVTSFQITLARLDERINALDLRLKAMNAEREFIMRKRDEQVAELKRQVDRIEAAITLMQAERGRSKR